MESKRNFAVAVLVPASTTVDTVDAQLTGPMRTLMPGVIDHYRLGGEFTGAWDPDYEPRTDPENWRPCTACAATGEFAEQPCATCADAAQNGRRTGTVLASPENWRPHRGDIVALTRLLNPDWRMPARHGTAGEAANRIPDLFADRQGIVWVGGTSSGETPDALRTVWNSLLDGTRQVTASREPFDAAAWSVAIVAAHCTPDEVSKTLPIVGSFVLITDPDWVEPDESSDQIYVVIDDFQAPYYGLMRGGDCYGPTVPGYAITEVDPSRVTLRPAPQNDLPYREVLARRRAFGNDSSATGPADTAQLE